ncbi:imidazoleglycerol-phosphate dehydratase 1, chloroplastic isoform X6 [Populus trichocarpa]|uniref:imidazoleglycerol-phosphate dehydratase 1, chloroplastic isoform X6 n=1 Tax=Populus trichocarpa TaxID=3694 RepID=UPI000D18A173|nr:imidazoleglycerol-phosphate dehydratase 1, chloroplastic isoform X6 [Populus trichocarpa]|eukprot:XP_024462011.1 imidazoleglycerol-phosphate dehydratase 1, chloroplastic isoform X7 [Populus trichocarpa]
MDSHTTITTKTSKPLQAYRSSLTTSSPIESRTNLFIINNSIFISFFPLYFAKFGFFFGWCSAASARIGEVKRVTNETNVSVKFNLDGTGIADSTTGIPFLDHMLDRLSSHGLFDVHVRATGDIHIDDHHTNEDVALAIGTALLQALGDRKGINRFGDFSAPLDEALIHVSLDLSGRPYLGYDLQIPTQRVGTYDTQLVEHFFQSLVNTSVIKECSNVDHSLLEEILIILLRQPSKLLPGLFDKQQNMTHVASGLCQAQRGFTIH